MDEYGLGDVPLLVGGIIPDADHSAMRAAGVAGIFGPGTSTDAIAAHIRQLLAAGSHDDA
jgi:methylmalonyl-CoA mutase cobalamin-binding domain/chain